MTDILEIGHEDVLERKCVLLWSKLIHGVKVSGNNLSRLFRILLQKEIKQRNEDVSS